MKRLIISLLLFATVSFATTINVPADQSTIQAGIDAASSGDTVLVAAGTYVENINYNGKNIALIGEDRETTIIDGNQNGSVATFNNGEGSTAILSGFTLRNGYQNPKGGGIYISGATPQLEYLIITENIADPVSDSGSGGGVMVEYSDSTTFDHVILTSNSGISGGGIFVDHNSNVILTNCTITQNTAENGGGITMYNSSATLNNTILWGNNTTNTQQMFINNSSLTITYSDIEGLPGAFAGNGNIDSDPLFVDPDNGDYTLQSSSPCIDAGDPTSDLDPDGTVADMGAFYYDQQVTNTHSLSFDGTDDYVDVSYTSGQIGSEISISAWVNLSSNSNGGHIIFNGCCGTDATWYWGMILENSDAGGGIQPKIMLHTDQGINGQGHKPPSGTGIITPNSGWHHVAMTYGSNTLKIYLDGTAVHTETVQGSDVTESNMVNIGGWENADGTFVGSMDGNIDEVAIWNTELTESQIQTYMSTSLSGSETELVGYWNFNEGTGTTLNDQTSNDNDGTITGATWSTDVPFTGTTTTSALTWSVQAQASLGSYNDNDNYLGVSSDATNTFDAAYDEVEPPASPGSSISLYFPHPEWNSILGDNFSTDARPEIALTDTMQVWDFEVVSTDAGDATLTFVFTDVPSVPVILENTATGARENLSNNETYTFTAVADSAHPFRVSIGDTTAPALALGLSCTGPAILISDSTHSLGWTSTDGYEVDSVLISFSSDSGTTYALQAALGTVSGYNWTVPDAVVMTGGKFKIKAQDYAGNNTEKISDYVFAIAGDSLSAAVTAGWTLWGTPINPANDTMSTNLNDDFTDYWVTYDYVDNGYTYDGILAEAEGYWLGAVQDATIDVKGTPVNSNFTMSLSQGWELISNPLVLDVSVDSLTFTKNDMTKTHAEAVTAGWVNSIYGYSGTGYTAASTFAPWSGYWVAVLETGVDMTFPIHRHDGSGSARSREDDWMITFDAQVDGANDGTTMIGYAETATDGFDAEHDAVQPPNPPGPDYVSLFIAHPEWNYPLGDKFAKDIRATVPDDEYKEWLLSIESSESDVQLNWTLMNIPDDYEVGYNIDDGIYFNDMRSVGTINISADTEIIVRVGSQVLGIADETIPYVYALQQNYPNPFNPVTTLRYDLPEKGFVTITIYDMLGRQVRTLINQTQDAGFKSVLWNATNDYGKPVSAGVYLYKIQAGEFVQTKKMVLLK